MKVNKRSDLFAANCGDMDRRWEAQQKRYCALYKQTNHQGQICIKSKQASAKFTFKFTSARVPSFLIEAFKTTYFVELHVA